MKRNILFSLMMIGAVASLIAGASFSAFTDSDTLTGTITAGNVQVSIGGPGTLSWSPQTEGTCNATGQTSTPTPIGSDDVCVSTVNVDYSGNLDAHMIVGLVFTPTVGPAGCFVVDLAWNPTVGTGDDSTDGASPLELVVPVAGDGVLTVTVRIDPDLPDGGEGANTSTCQNASINLTLTVTATEGAAPV